MKIAETDILIIPGIGMTEADHWARRWAIKMPTAQVVEQAEWDKPDLETWLKTIEHAVMMSTRPVALVGHSLGCIAIAHLASRLVDTKVRGAFLVAVPDLEGNADVPKAAAAFKPVPREPLPFPSFVIGSENDPLSSAEHTADISSAWGSEFHNAGEAGHINTASGHGPWPEGMMMFARFMQRLKA